MKNISLLVLGFLIFTSASHAVTPAKDSIYNFKVKSLFGDPVDLSHYQGKALLIVNTASKCGFTPQYEALQKVYAEYHAKGVEVLGFPSNDFKKQEPGTPTEIKKTCDTYHVSFPVFEKNPVSGNDKQPLYDWLVNHDPIDKGSEVKWNFEKFVISKDGKVIARFRSSTTPDSPEVRKALDSAIQ